MEELTLDDLIKIVREYNPDAVEKVKKAYDYAKELHKGQYRQSGEEYISHPLNVCYILAEMHADCDTLCAGLLHDTLEDTNASKEEIITLFGENVCTLVEGVTKFTKINFQTKEEENLANMRKIITSIINDPRILIIKLADRLHNMRTLDFKTSEKQIEKAKETMNIYVPLASYIGAYHIKTELEDLSFKYLEPEKYHNILEQKYNFEKYESDNIFELEKVIHNFLLDNNIPNDMKVRTKNIYGIYRKMKKGFTLDEMHDLVALKVVVSQVMDCYKSLGLIHSKYHPLNYKFKDYISSPKTNMYQSLHTSIFGPFNRLIQCQNFCGKCPEFFVLRLSAKRRCLQKCILVVFRLLWIKERLPQRNLLPQKVHKVHFLFRPWYVLLQSFFPQRNPSSNHLHNHIH